MSQACELKTTLLRSLDLETDEKMREVIRDKLAGSTVLAVAHRICELCRRLSAISGNLETDSFLLTPPVSAPSFCFDDIPC